MKSSDECLCGCGLAAAYRARFHRGHAPEHLRKPPVRSEKRLAWHREREQRRRVEELYGISWEKYETLVETQNKKCALCGDEESVSRNGRVKRLAVDHDHVTGKVRALLCQSCNAGLGYFKDDKGRLEAAIQYLALYS